MVGEGRGRPWEDSWSGHCRDDDEGDESCRKLSEVLGMLQIPGLSRKGWSVVLRGLI